MLFSSKHNYSSLTNSAELVFTPNKAPTRSSVIGLYIAWAVGALMFWSISSGKIMPGPGEVLRALPNLWINDGLGLELWNSIMLNAQAVGLLILLSLLVAYGTVVPALRPFAHALSIGRFNGSVGIPILFTLWLRNPHYVKVALLVFWAGVYTVPSLVSIIESIPSVEFDHARTLRMGRWRVVWEVVVLGRFSEVLDALRTNAAMCWMFVPMVEVLFRYEGGIGPLAWDMNKHLELASVYAITLVVLAVGILQDYIIRFIQSTLCPYASLGLEHA